MDGKFEFILEKFENALGFQVTAMPEKLRGTLNYADPRTGWMVTTAATPALYDSQILLWGQDKNSDNHVSIYKCKNNEDRDERFQAVVDTLNEWWKSGSYKKDNV